MAEPWTLDELAHAGHEHLAPRSWPASMTSKAAPILPRTSLCSLAAVLARSPPSSTWARGPDSSRCRAARVFGKVIAVDISPAMLEVLRNRASELGLDNLDCIEAGFLSYEHAGPPADAVYTRNALHQLPDFWKALALTRIAAFLRAGGVLRLHDLIYDFQPSQAEAVFTRWLGHAATDPNRGYTARTSPSTSAPSTAPFAGCSSRCSALPGLRSRPRTSTDRCTEPTPASRPEAVETIGSPRREKIPSACSWS